MISNQFIKIVQNNTTRIFFFFSMNTPNRSNDWVLIPGSIIRVCYGKKKKERRKMQWHGDFADRVKISENH